ncbi:hypothetical protein LCGC14_1885860 [marine sediment metagenome]|uniref:Uncharacterized protein n=1 Tax=marine sediment metagenome TaxID=412755 RepID=A0A0F9IEV3_9ZZZZ
MRYKLTTYIVCLLPTTIVTVLTIIAMAEVRVLRVPKGIQNFPRKISKIVQTENECGLLERFDNWSGRCETLTILAVESVTVEAGESVGVMVHGAINGEETFGATILVELVARKSNRGDIWFTHSPPSDIIQVGGPWIDIGVFSSYDTDLSFSDYLNGTVDDDGNYLPVPVWYSGTLSLFPVQVSEDASGVWDIHLNTSAGDSDWEGVSTVLRSGTITVE